MPNSAPNRSQDVSQWVYQRLLAAYPRRHRDQYGGAMAQLFRDQCRDAWGEARTWGLVALWLRTVPDLLKTSFIERCSNFNPGKFMTDKMNALRPRKLPTFVFFAVFFPVLLLTLIVATAVTFILPESYASTARIKVEPDDPGTATVATGGTSSQPLDPYFLQTTFEIIQSQVVLSNVINTLNLNVDWGRKYYNGETLKTSETMDILRRRMDLRTVRNTSLISITAYSDDKNECATLANAVAQSYLDYRAQARQAVENQNLASLQSEYTRQDGQMDQLQAEKDTLAQKYSIQENREEFEKKYEGQIEDGKRACEVQKNQLNQLQGLSPDKLRDVLPTITGDYALADLLGKLNAAKQQYVTLAKDYGPADLHIVRIEAELGELQKEIDARVAGIMTALDTEVNLKQANLKALQAALDAARENSKPTAENKPYWDKKHELEGLASYHATVGAKLDLEKLNLTMIRDPIVAFTDYAEPGDAPVKPNKPLNIVVGGIFGIFLGAVAGGLAAFLVGRAGRRKAPAGTV